MSPALYIGRFQPFHNGHLNALEQIFEHEEKVIVAIGSSNESGTTQNPFTADQRAAMINATLAEHPAYAGRYKIIYIPDINDHPKWPTHVENTVRANGGAQGASEWANFGTVYTGSALTKALFEQYSSHSVRDLKQSIAVSGTEVRLKMERGENWATLVPLAVAAYIKNLALTVI